MKPEYQSVKHIDVSKAVRPSWVFVMENAVKGLMRFIGRSLPPREGAYDGTKKAHVDIWTRCVSV